jgi:hypothetical protein
MSVLPLTYSYGALIPYMSGKTLFLRGVLFLVTALSAYGYFCNTEFRKGITQKCVAAWKNPIVKAVAVSYGLLVLSTLFAFDRYLAFFGTLQRGEGLVSFTFFYAFFFFAVLFFEKKQWQYFAFGTLATTWVLFVYELIQFHAGADRPGSFADNPIFLASYYVFSLFVALLVLRAGVTLRKWYLSLLGLLTIGIVVIGIFITGTRGVLLGMGVGFLAVLGYFLVVGKRIQISRSLHARHIAAGILCVSLVLAGIFISTRDAALWQTLPGFNRLAKVSLTDATTRARLINTEITLRAVNPASVGIARTLVGWGWDNYIFAWQKFYDPSIYAYDPGIFDRAHDFLLDRIVMTGILGFIAYLSIWYFFARLVFGLYKKDAYIAASCIFFGVTFFVQNLSVFDTIITFVAFFAVLAYVLYENTVVGEKEKHVRKK